MKEVRDLVRRARNQRTRVHVNMRSVGVGRVGMCILCVGDNEERERGVGTNPSTCVDVIGRSQTTGG